MSHLSEMYGQNSYKQEEVDSWKNKKQLELWAKFPGVSAFRCNSSGSLVLSFIS
jgi:hypothetical protein